MRRIKFIPDNRITLLHSGAEFFPALEEAIDGAQVEIYLETYIFADDETAVRIQSALERAAQRGVVVNVTTDWLGTGHRRCLALNAAFRRAGVNHRIFNAWFRRGATRLHRKICVVDRSVAFLGGMNINDDMHADNDYHVILPAPRWDFAVRIAGPLVEEIYREAERQWMLLGGLNLRYRWERFLRNRRGIDEADGAGMSAALLVRDNLRNRSTILKAYLQALGNARGSALLVTPYFAPGRKLRAGLAAAVRRGVGVTLLIGVGQFRIQDAVARWFYPKLMKAGVKVVEYRKTQLHGKVAVIDDAWAMVGSSNWDGLSLQVNQEANVVIRDAEFAQELRHHIERGIAEGVTVPPREYAYVPWYRRLWYGAAYLFYRSVLRLIAAGRYEE
jgi:cardiolipin synthase